MFQKQKIPVIIDGMYEKKIEKQVAGMFQKQKIFVIINGTYEKKF